MQGNPKPPTSYSDTGQLHDVFFGSHPTLGGNTQGGSRHRASTAGCMQNRSFCIVGCFPNRAPTRRTAGLDSLFDAMSLMCFWSWCLLNRASTWGMAGFDVLFAAMPLMRFPLRVLMESSVYMGDGSFDLLCAAMTRMSFRCRRLRNRASTWGTAGFDVVRCRMCCYSSLCLGFLDLMSAITPTHCPPPETTVTLWCVQPQRLP